MNAPLASLTPSPSSDKVCHGSFIGHHAQGRSLVDFLSDRFRYFSPEQWKEHIATLDVLVNGVSALPEQILSAGDRVEYFAMKRPEPRVPRDIPIIYQDEDLLIVNKPPHIPVHPTGRYLRNTLIHVLQAQTRLPFLILCHRLDRETSGLCVLAKTPLAKDKMYWAFFKSEVAKTYWGLVWGKPQPPSGTIDVPIGTAIGSRIRIKQAVNGTQAKSARTKYHTLGTQWVECPEWTPPPWPALLKSMKNPSAKGPWPLSLVECTPITGRTNQIRVHLTELGCGIVGDKLYDPDESVFMNFKDGSMVLDNDKRTKGFVILSPELKRRLVLDAHALHARKISFRHPRTGRPLTLEAPPPSSWHGLYAGQERTSREGARGK